MKKEEVPQDKSGLSKKKLKEVCYATNEDGKYVCVKSSGWKVKSEALDITLDTINNRLKEIVNLYSIKEASPICFFMEYKRMDLNILSAYVGMYKWRVRRHLKYKHFVKLTKKHLEKYALVFDIDVNDLVNPTFSRYIDNEKNV